MTSNDGRLPAEDVQDFTSSNQPVRFRVNGEEFEAVSELPLLTALELADRLDRLDDPDTSTAERASVVQDLLRVLLVADSAGRFVTRLTDQRRPIGAATFRNVLTWLLRQHGHDAPTGGGTSG